MLPWMIPNPLAISGVRYALVSMMRKRGFPELDSETDFIRSIELAATVLLLRDARTRRLEVPVELRWWQGARQLWPIRSREGAKQLPVVLQQLGPEIFAVAFDAQEGWEFPIIGSLDDDLNMRNEQG